MVSNTDEISSSDIIQKYEKEYEQKELKDWDEYKNCFQDAFPDIIEGKCPFCKMEQTGETDAEANFICLKCERKIDNMTK
ncbi:hypothetical protein KAJ41_01535 [Candidatus Parcubacteria bacterium]|nr:hypothetical protein [Candidatus Parcubacteria bacterium]